MRILVLNSRYHCLWHLDWSRYDRRWLAFLDAHGLLTVIVGSISLIKQLAMSKSRSCPAPRTLNMLIGFVSFPGPQRLETGHGLRLSVKVRSEITIDPLDRKHDRSFFMR